jgi:hypothetical protein
MIFKVLNFNSPNNSDYIFGYNCFDDYMPITKEFISRGLYGELNPDIEKFKTTKTIEFIDRTFISHKILEISMVHDQLIVDIELLQNINGIALKESVDCMLDVTLLPRIVAYEVLNLEIGKIRINKAKIVTFDVFIK